MFTSTASTTSTSKTNKVANKDNTCSRQLRMTCAGDKTTIEGYRIIDVLTFFAYQLLFGVKDVEILTK